MTIVPRNDLVNLLNGWTGSSLATSRSSSSCTSHAPHVRHAARSTSGCPKQLGDDGVADSLHLLLLLVEPSTSASWLASNHLMASSHLSLMALRSSSEILSFIFSSSMVVFILKQ